MSKLLISRKVVFLILILIGVAGATSWVLIELNDEEVQRGLPENVYYEYGCDRATADYRETDKYCADPSLYWAEREEESLIWVGALLALIGVSAVVGFAKLKKIPKGKK